MKVLFTAAFPDEHGLVDAVSALRARGMEIADVHTPFPVHGMDEAMGLRRTRMPIVCAILAFTGAALMGVFQWWVSTRSWPLNIGGKPFFAAPGFIPVTFEGAVLLAAVGSVVVLFLRCGLRPGRVRWQPERVCDDRFVLAVVPRGDAFDPLVAADICRGHGAIEAGFVEVAP